MAIKIDVLMGNGSLAGYHEISKLEAQPKSDTAVVTVNSYVSEESYITTKFIIWQQPINIPVSVICGSDNLFTGIYEYLVTDQNSAFVNGVILDTSGSDIEKARASKIEQLKSMCFKSITAGFYSEALGTKYLYPAKVLDQSNLVASVLDSTLSGVGPDWSTPFWNSDENDVWAFRQHTAAEIQQVGKDGKAAILANIFKNEVLATQVREADTIEQIDAIQWDSVEEPNPDL